MKKKFVILLAALIVLSLCLCACAHQHKLVKVERNEATCTTDGNIEYWQCSSCDKKFNDDTGSQEITDVVIPASHKYGEYVYDFDTKSYERSCSACKDVQSVAAGSNAFPILARNETELAAVIGAATEQSVIKLANDITITTEMFAVVLRLPDNGTLDLGGHTVTVKNNGGFVVEGTNVTLQNGYVVTDYAAPKEGYAVFIGDEGQNNSVTVKNLNTRGGLNVYNCEATLYDCIIDASAHTYYALWADEHSTITVESGLYRGGEIACIHSTASTDPEGVGNIVLNGGEFHGKIMATYGTTINGGTFDSDIVLLNVYDENAGLYVNARLVVNKDINSSLNVIIDNSTKYDMVCSTDTDGSFVYETVSKI